MRAARSESKPGGAVVVLEDLHWAERETLTVGRYLLDNTDDHGALSLRPDSGDALAMVRRLADIRAARLLDLGPLADQEVDNRVLACLGTDAAPDALLDLLRMRATVRPLSLSRSTGAWWPSFPNPAGAAGGDVHRRLSAPGARIADIGCGHGWSTIALARAYPQAEVTGYDADTSSILEARRHAQAAELTVNLVESDATALSDHGPFDAVVVLETLHDLARPVETLSACRKALADGIIIIIDEKVAAGFTAPGNVIERLMYGWSISHCLPAAMAEQPSAALGTVLREDAIRALATTARLRLHADRRRGRRVLPGVPPRWSTNTGDVVDPMKVWNVGAVKHGRNMASRPASEHGAVEPASIGRSFRAGPLLLARTACGAPEVGTALAEVETVPGG